LFSRDEREAMPMSDTSVETVYILRTCGPNGEAYGGFVWPESGPVGAPDWRDDGKCGGGLHGFLRGEGKGSLADFDINARWLVVEVALKDVRELSGKVKFPRGVVIYSGSRQEATRLVSERHPGSAVVGGTATAGGRGTATAGTPGTATAGYGGTATAGDDGTATAGYGGTATAGDRGTATAGGRGTATAGNYGTLVIKYYDAKVRRLRLAIAYVGEDGIEANVAYMLDSNHKFVKKEVK
jgi:hypothetical protein